MIRKFVYHHLGLGDHIICHGIVREILKTCDTLHIACKQHNMSSVYNMFIDEIDRISLIQGNDNTIGDYLNIAGNLYNEIIRIGFSLNETESFEKQFYKMADVDFEKKWSNFYIEETERQNKFSIEQPYSFVHDDKRFPISPGILKTFSSTPNRFIVSENPTESVTDYIKVIKAASEIHVIDSAFLFLIDCLHYDSSKQKLFIHRYARENPSWCLPILKKNWNIIR